MLLVVSLFLGFYACCFLPSFVFDTINLVLDHLLYPMIG